MVGVSNRIVYGIKQAGRPPDTLIKYEVLDPNHEPDLNGELAGGKVYLENGKQFVKLTEEQARFYLDSGSIQVVAEEGAQAQAASAPAEEETK